MTKTVLSWMLMLSIPVAGAVRAQQIPKPERVWRPVADRIYLQEENERVETSKPVTAVAQIGGKVFAVVGGSLNEARNGALEPIADAPNGITRLRKFDETLWALADSGVYRLSNGAWQKIDERPFVDLTLHLGAIYGATRDDLFQLVNGKFVSIKPAGGYLSNDTTLLQEDFTQNIPDPVQIGPILRIGSYSGTLYMLRSTGIALLEGKTFVPDPIDWGALPSPNVRDMTVRGSRLFVATDRGLGVLRGMAMGNVRGPEGLPYEDTTCVTPGFANDLWIGTTCGAIRWIGDGFQYFGAQNWLPADRVNDIAVANRKVVIATDGGLAIIRYEPYTLRKKAAFYEREMEEWGFKRLGFVNPIYRNPAPPAPLPHGARGESEWIRGITDNDGGNTSYYLAAMCFKYAATGDEEARKQAVDAFNAMNWLETITDHNGFIARAVWSNKGDKGQREMRGSGGLPAKWYPTPDGLWMWKGDTSSDEVNAHFYAVSLFHDLVAKGREKERARDHIANLTSHIIDNGWVLRDVDGKPTRWGRWDPKYLQTPYGSNSIGLNGMEAQTYVITAYALTGDPKFQAGLDQLLRWRYHLYTVRQRITFPPDYMAPWDDELAFYCYHTLLRYAKDPELRSIYLRSIERSWETLRIQQLGFFNFTYGAMTGNDCEVDQATERLRDYPLDLVNWSYHNSHRTDLHVRQGYTPIGLPIPRALSARETSSSYGSNVSLTYDGGGNGNSVEAPSEWLQDYWMGRYYGMIEAPTTKDQKALTVRPRPFKRHGAAPYDGPPRPELR